MSGSVPGGCDGSWSEKRMKPLQQGVERTGRLWWRRRRRRRKKKPRGSRGCAAVGGGEKGGRKKRSNPRC